MTLLDIKKRQFGYCFSCNKGIKRNEALCDECYNELKLYNSDRKCSLCNRRLIASEDFLCEYCAKFPPAFDGAIALYSYKGDFKEALSKLKFRKKYYKLKSASILMAMQFEKMHIACDVIVPVPTFFLNYGEREYCTAIELAHFLGKKYNIPVYDNMLIKKFAKQQAKIDFDKRMENVKGKFFFNKKYKDILKGKTVLIVDDIITSGATASECAGVLKQNGAEYVYVSALLYGGEGRRERM